MRNSSVLVLFGALAMTAAASADSVQLHRDDVIPVVMQTELSFSGTKAGDVFKAEVTDTHMLPLGSHLEGVVDRVVQKDGKKRGFMDIEFTSIILPDGHRAGFHGTPIPMSKNYVVQDRDGRWEAKKGVSKDTVVLGATAGGLLIGSMIHKPFEGAFLGALIGILAGETDKEDVADGDIVVPKGSKVGARVDETITVDFDGRWDQAGANNDRYGPYDRDGYNKAGYDRYGYDHDGHYNAKYDGTKDAAADGSKDTKGYDKYGFDKDGRYNAKYDTTRNQPPPDRGSDQDIRLEIDHKPLHYGASEQPYHHGWMLMVPIRSTAEQLGFRVSRDTDEGTFRIENDTDVLVIEQDSKTYSLNHRRGNLPGPVEVRDGVAYAPIDAFTTLTKGKVYVNGTKYAPAP